MPETTIQTEPATRSDYWREQISEHERSGMSVRSFCKQRGLAEHAFFYWRKRFRERQQPVRFAVIGTAAARATAEVSLELVLVNGERLRIGAGVDGGTLRTVLEALRS